MEPADSWQISGSAAEKYERFVASWFASWATDLVERAGLQAGWRVLDLACGTGIVTRAAGVALGSRGTIVGSDLNDDMLVEANRHPVEGAAVQWHQADATELPFEDEYFDAVLCQQGLQFVPNAGEAVQELHRVLRPGGRAAVSVWGRAEENPYIAALALGLSRHLSPEAGAVMLAPCALGDIDELAALFEPVGFSSLDIETVTIDREPTDAVEAIGGNLVAIPVAAQVLAMEPAAYTQMIDDIVSELSDHISDGLLTAPNRAHVVIATS